VLEPGCDIRRLFLQAGAQLLSILGVLEKCFLVADALDLVTDFQRPVVFAECKLLQFRPERPDQGAQITRVILQVPYRHDARMAQRLFSDISDAVNHSHRQRPQK